MFFKEFCNSIITELCIYVEEYIEKTKDYLALNKNDVLKDLKEFILLELRVGENKDNKNFKNYIKGNFDD